jgi:hypothetical protein
LRITTSLLSLGSLLITIIARACSR